MKPYTKTYIQHFGFGMDSFIPCEICGSRAVDIHHIDCRGMGASTANNKIENLMALCRAHHLEFGDKKQHMEFLKETHQKYLQTHT